MVERAIDPLAVCIDAIYGIGKPRGVALIDEATCIGCTLCIQACPVDAIIGAARQMHTVVAAWCTGCELCLPPCPVDCISMPPAGQTEDLQVIAGNARRRYQSLLLRKANEQREKAGRLAATAAARQLTAATETRQALIAAAIARARELNAG
ncbi:MAG: RnfABCDGE type electron transport complex subunit B [Rhodocyclaceae bacterium]|nr:MAG: RnfABCDGE type electron transport complex subunit B [Rhodocyclaceae bacterium]